MVQAGWALLALGLTPLVRSYWDQEWHSTVSAYDASDVGCARVEVLVPVT